MPTKQPFAELTVERCAAELWLNEIPVARLGPDGPLNISVPANLYVVDGENRLELIVESGSPQGSAHARLALFNPGEFTGEPGGEVLLRTEWIPQPGTETRPPYTEQTSARLGSMNGPWAWQSAPRLRLDPHTVAAVAAVLERIRSSLERGDPSVMLELARPKFEAAARAWPARTYPQLAMQFRAMVQRLPSTPGWAMQPLDPENFNFRLVAGSRLIECINKDWKPTVRSVPLDKGFPNYYAMCLGLSNGSFAIFL